MTTEHPFAHFVRIQGDGGEIEPRDNLATIA
jgi:hypothetical protein